MSEIIRGASQYTKCEDCRGHYGNNINKLKKKYVIVEMYQNVPEEIRIRENCVRKVGRIKKGITEVTEDGILTFLDMQVSVQNFIEKLIHITTRII
jgi:hypothetical protein